MSFSMTVRKFVLIEVLLIITLVVVGVSVGGEVDGIWYVATMMAVHCVLYVPIGIKEGFSFNVHDAPPDSWVKYYGFFIIFLSAFAANTLDDIFYSLFS